MAELPQLASELFVQAAQMRSAIAQAEPFIPNIGKNIDVVRATTGRIADSMGFATPELWSIYAQAFTQQLVTLFEEAQDTSDGVERDVRTRDRQGGLQRVLQRIVDSQNSPEDTGYQREARRSVVAVATGDAVMVQKAGQLDREQGIETIVSALRRHGSQVQEINRRHATQW